MSIKAIQFKPEGSLQVTRTDGTTESISSHDQLVHFVESMVTPTEYFHATIQSFADTEGSPEIYAKLANEKNGPIKTFTYIDRNMVESTVNAAQLHKKVTEDLDAMSDTLKKATRAVSKIYNNVDV